MIQVSKAGFLVLEGRGLVYAFGPLDGIERKLQAMGVQKNEYPFAVAHTHFYHKEKDSEAKRILGGMALTAPDDLRNNPLPSDWTVAAGLEAYLAENGFSKASYDAARTPATFWRFRFSVPNPPKHRWAIMLHDLHHVATGYGTDPAGEGQLSAWELRKGLKPLGLYVGTIVFSGFLLGLLVAPRKTMKAWRSSKSGKSLFSLNEYRYEDLMKMKIGELRKLLNVAEGGLFQEGLRGLHSGAPREKC